LRCDLKGELSPRVYVLNERGNVFASLTGPSLEGEFNYCDTAWTTTSGGGRRNCTITSGELVGEVRLDGEISHRVHVSRRTGVINYADPMVDWQTSGICSQIEDPRPPTRF